MPKRPYAIFLILMFSSAMPSLDRTPAWAEEPKALQAGEIPISVLEGMEEEDPVITWDGKNYVVVWQTNRKDPDDYDLYATHVSPEGKILDPQIPVSTAYSNQIFTDIACGNGLDLVVWQDLRSRQRWEIYGARLRSDGTVLDPQGIPIATGKRNARHPQVAWSGKNFLVVWMEENEGRGWDVAGVRVSPQGKVVDRDRILIAKTPGDQAHPALAWGKDQYLVVWMDHPPGISPKISGARVSASGKVLDPEGLVLSPSSRDPSFPAVAWGKEGFMVVWADQPASKVYTLSRVLMSPSGEVDDRNGFVVESSSSLHTFPSLSCTENECLIVWEKDQSQGGPMRGIENVIRDVKGAWIDLSQRTVTPHELIIAPKAIGNHFAKVASNGRDYLVVWKDYRNGTAASLGRFVTSSR